MVAVQVAQGPIRTTGCAQLYKCAQTRWTCKLAMQMAFFVLSLAVSMGAGGAMPWLLKHFLGRSSIHQNPIPQKVYREAPGYSYINTNTYSYCRAAVLVGDPLPRGYPAPPLSPKGSKLFEAWHHQPVTLKGMSWPGFNSQTAGMEGLHVGHDAMAVTDLRAITYQLKLLGFNTIKLPFSFQTLKVAAANQEVPCKPSNKSTWALRASDPMGGKHPDTGQLVDPPVYIKQGNATCNDFLPKGTGLGRLLWTLQYFAANGFYIVLSFQPVPGETLHQDAEAFALAWLSLWTPITCLDNFSADIRGRLLLDLLHEPSRLSGGGIGWSPEEARPGLTKLYLTAMDAIESITPRDALYMLQGSAVSHYWATGPGGGLNAFGLSPGDGFILDQSAITAYQLSDPTPFLERLMQRTYRNRVVLAPHLLGPSSSGAVLDTPDDLVHKMNSSWGRLSSEGFCSGLECFRLPVVAGEIGSRLDAAAEVEYYNAVADYANLRHDASTGSEQQPLQGWIWAGYSNVTGPGPLLEGDWAQFDWPLLRYLVEHFGLVPWYQNPQAWLHQASQEQFDANAAAAVAAAAAAEKAANATPAAAAAGNMTGTLELLYQRAASDALSLNGSALLPALANAAGAAHNSSSHTFKSAPSGQGLEPAHNSSTPQVSPGPVSPSPAITPGPTVAVEPTAPQQLSAPAMSVAAPLAAPPPAPSPEVQASPPAVLSAMLPAVPPPAPAPAPESSSPAPAAAPATTAVQTDVGPRSSSTGASSAGSTAQSSLATLVQMANGDKGLSLPPPAELKAAAPPAAPAPAAQPSEAGQSPAVTSPAAAAPAAGSFMQPVVALPVGQANSPAVPTAAPTAAAPAAQMQSGQQAGGAPAAATSGSSAPPAKQQSDQLGSIAAPAPATVERGADAAAAGAAAAALGAPTPQPAQPQGSGSQPTLSAPDAQPPTTAGSMQPLPAPVPQPQPQPQLQAPAEPPQVQPQPQPPPVPAPQLPPVAPPAQEPAPQLVTPAPPQPASQPQLQPQPPTPTPLAPPPGSAPQQPAPTPQQQQQPSPPQAPMKLETASMPLMNAAPVPAEPPSSFSSSSQHPHKLFSGGVVLPRASPRSHDGDYVQEIPVQQG